jgi:aminopeptidase YwaD
LKRAAFTGAVTAWYLANMSDDDVPAILKLLERNALTRSAELVEHRKTLSNADAAAVTGVHFTLERKKVHSVEPFATMNEDDHKAAVAYLEKLEALVAIPMLAIEVPRDNTVYERNPDVKGPMHGFGFSYIDDKLGGEASGNLKLGGHSTEHRSGGEFVYEALNFVDGKRTVSDIRDWLVAELGEVPLEYVAEYLQALDSIGVLTEKK